MKYCRRLIVVPLTTFHRLAETIGDPTGEMTFLFHRPRCGSTLLVQVHYVIRSHHLCFLVWLLLLLSLFLISNSYFPLPLKKELDILSEFSLSVLVLYLSIRSVLYLEQISKLCLLASAAATATLFKWPVFTADYVGCPKGERTFVDYWSRMPLGHSVSVQQIFSELSSITTSEIDEFSGNDRQISIRKHAKF